MINTKNYNYYIKIANSKKKYFKNLTKRHWSKLMNWNHLVKRIFHKKINITFLNQPNLETLKDLIGNLISIILIYSYSKINFVQSNKNMIEFLEEPKPKESQEASFFYRRNDYQKDREDQYRKTNQDLND